MVERVSDLLGGSSTPTSTTDSKPADLETQCAQVCAKMLNSLSVIEHYFKTGEGESQAFSNVRSSTGNSIAQPCSPSTTTTDKSYLDHSRRIITSLPILSRLRTNSSISPASHSKIDKIIERLRYVVMKRHKGEKRVDQLTTGAGEKREEKSEEVQMCERVLEAVVSHVESLSRNFGKEVGPLRFPAEFVGRGR